MNQSKQSGFAPILVVTLAVAAIAVGSLIIWRIIGSREPAQSGQPQANTQSNAASEPQQTDPNAGYVVVTEWDIRFKPKSGLSGVEYFKPRNVTTDALSFTTSELASKEPRCSKARGTMVVGMLTRSKDPQPSDGGVLAVIDGYSYQYRVSGAACSETDAGLELESKFASELSASLKTLEATQ